MNTPKTDRLDAELTVYCESEKDDVVTTIKNCSQKLLDHARQLETQVMELRGALELCLNEMGRGMGIDDRFDAICYKARAILEKTK